MARWFCYRSGSSCLREWVTMQLYCGMKIIRAKPMNRLEYNELRGWTVPADENPEDEGYRVEYVDGGKANTAEYAGYVSWSPKDVFERAYRPTAVAKVWPLMGYELRSKLNKKE